MATIRIELPDEWVDAWWGAYLDGNGEQGFLQALDDDGLCPAGEGYGDSDRKTLLIRHSDKPLE